MTWATISIASPTVTSLSVFEDRTRPPGAKSKSCLRTHGNAWIKRNGPTPTRAIASPLYQLNADNQNWPLVMGEQSCYPGSGGKNGRDQCYQCVAHNVATMAQIKINSQPAAQDNCGCGIDNSADRTERHGPRQHPFVVEQHCGQEVRHSR